MVGRRSIVADTDFHELPRRRLQQLCKRHGIPANKTNAAMADALTDIYRNGNLPPPSPYATPRHQRVRNSEPGMSEYDESECSDSQLGSQLATPCASVLSPIPDEPSHSYFCAESAQKSHVVVGDAPENEALPALAVSDLDVELQKGIRKLDVLHQEFISDGDSQMVTPSASVLSPIPDETLQPDCCDESTEDSHVVLVNSPRNEALPAVGVVDQEVEVQKGISGPDVLCQESGDDSGEPGFLAELDENQLSEVERSREDTSENRRQLTIESSPSALVVAHFDQEMQDDLGTPDVLQGQEVVTVGAGKTLVEDTEGGLSPELKRIEEEIAENPRSLSMESLSPAVHVSDVDEEGNTGMGGSDTLQEQEMAPFGVGETPGDGMEGVLMLDVERVEEVSNENHLSLFIETLSPAVDADVNEEGQKGMSRSDIVQERESVILDAKSPVVEKMDESAENHTASYIETRSPVQEDLDVEEGQIGMSRSDIVQEQEFVLPAGGESSAVEEMEVDMSSEVKSTHGGNGENYTNLMVGNLDEGSQVPPPRKELYKKTVFGEQSPSIRALKRALKEKQTQREELINKRRMAVSSTGGREFGTPLRINGDSISSMTEEGSDGVVRKEVAPSPTPTTPSVIIYQDDASTIVEDTEALVDEVSQDTEPSSVAAVSRESARLVGQKQKSVNHVPKLYGRKQWVEKAMESAAQKRLEDKERLLSVAATAHVMEDKENVQTPAGGRTAEMLKKHQEGYKTPLTGKSREKARQVSKKLAQGRRKLVLNEKRAMGTDVGPALPVGDEGVESTTTLIQ